MATKATHGSDGRFTGSTGRGRTVVPSPSDVSTSHRRNTAPTAADIQGATDAVQKMNALFERAMHPGYSSRPVIKGGVEAARQMIAEAEANPGISDNSAEATRDLATMLDKDPSGEFINETYREWKQKSIEDNATLDVAIETKWANIDEYREQAAAGRASDSPEAVAARAEIERNEATLVQARDESARSTSRWLAASRLRNALLGEED